MGTISSAKIRWYKYYIYKYRILFGYKSKILLNTMPLHELLLFRIRLVPIPDRNGRPALRLIIQRAVEEDRGTYACRVGYGDTYSTDTLTITVNNPGVFLSLHFSVINKK